MAHRGCQCIELVRRVACDGSAHPWSQSETVAFNKDQRIVIVGQSEPRKIRQTAMLLGFKEVQVTCVEFSVLPKCGRRSVAVRRDRRREGAREAQPNRGVEGVEGGFP